MPTPDFIVELRRHVGHTHLFLIGITAVVLREPSPAGGVDEVLLVQRVDTEEWTPVCGIVEPGEQLHEVAVREVAEEACIEAQIERLVWVKTYPSLTYPNGDVASYVNHTFRMRGVGVPRVGDDESLDARWFPIDELPPMRWEFQERIEWALANQPACAFGETPDFRA